MRRGGTVRNRGKAETARGDSPRGAISCQALFSRRTLVILSRSHRHQQTTVVAILETGNRRYDFCSPGRFVAAIEMNTTPYNVIVDELWLVFVVLYRSLAFFDEFCIVVGRFVAVRVKIVSKGSLCSINDAKTRRIANKNGSDRGSRRAQVRSRPNLLIAPAQSWFCTS
jgi:hypothetical protein